MSQWMVSIFVFFVVLFVYIHIYHHYKTSNDFEIYDIDHVTRDKLHEICELKQPFIFNFANSDSSIFETNLYNLSSQYDPFELNIRTSTVGDMELNTDSVPLSLDKAIALFDKTDDTMRYYSEDNYEFLTESGLLKKITTEDEELRPYMGCTRIYDVLTGSVNGYTPLRYEVNSRNYFMVVNGYIDVLLIPPNYTKYLRSQPNYETFEFNSLIDVWNVQDKYSQEYKKSKSMQITINTGKVLYIPPYWWYSIRFHKKASVLSMQYRTYMNNVAILPSICTHYLQMFNVKKNIIEHKQTITTQVRV